MSESIAFYRARPALVTFALSLLGLLAVWNAPLFRDAVIPYDYQTAQYPWYVDAVRAARYSPLCLYNPFNLAGQPTWNIFAFDDPVQWLPVYLPKLPGYTALQSLELLHLLLVPAALLLVARANDVPRDRYVWIAGISVIAYADGPTLKYMEQSSAIVASSYILLAFGALEAFRSGGKRRYAIIAGASIAYAFQAFVYPAMFLPIALAAYGAANYRSLFQTRHRISSLAIGAIVLIVVAAPTVLISSKVDRTIDIARHLTQVDLLALGDWPQIFGSPGSELQTIVIPAALVALVALGFGELTRLQKLAYGATIAALLLYGFGDHTSFGPFFRQIYPPAGLIRRPYTTWYLLLPLLYVLATLGLRSNAKLVVRFAGVASLVAVAYSLTIGVGALACGLVALTILITIWNPRLSLIVPLAVAQWILIDWIPFSTSAWQPHAIPEGARYMNPYADIRPFIGKEQARSTDAFRIANAGLPGQLGPSAGMFGFYNVAADFGTFIPHNLVEQLGTPDLRSNLPAYFEAEPESVGSARWERLATKYYLFSTDVFETLKKRISAVPYLHVVAPSPPWIAVEDDRARPFVSGVLSNGSTIPIVAAMTRDSFRFVVPPDVTDVRFAVNFDSWWHAWGDDDRAPIALRNDGGQLVLKTTGLRGKRVTIEFGDAATESAIVVSVATQVTIPIAFAVLGLRKRRRRFQIQASGITVSPSSAS